MRVLLVVPTFRYKEPSPVYLSMSDFPTGLGYLASALKNAGHEVVGLNANNDTKYPTSVLMVANRLQRTLVQEKPDLIGLGGLCIDYAFIKDAIEVTRRTTQAPIVVGGGIVTNDKEFVFKLLKPDFCIWGEAEEAIVKLADMLENNKHPRDIDNLAYWTEEGAVFNKTNYDYGNIDDRAFPDYEPFGIQEMLDNYSISTRLLYKYSRPYPRAIVITTARSCPFNCSFCVHRGGPKYRARSVGNIMQEIKELHEKYAFNILTIGDELFAANNKRMTDFCEGILEGRKKYGWDFDWMFQTHANARLDKETLKLAKKAGCFYFSYGMESASPKVLKSMNKKTNVGQYIEAIELAKEVGVGFGGNLLFGDPAETEETIDETLDFFAKHCQQSQVFMSPVVPYPGSQIFDDCLEKGIIEDKERYYETLGEVNYNMTQMKTEQLANWLTFLGTLENTWMMVQSTDATRIVEEGIDGNPLFSNGLRAHQIFAKCPFCGADLMYREVWNKDTTKVHSLGTGCQYCNKKIKINCRRELEVWP